jgi:hypothetical protein
MTAAEVLRQLRRFLLVLSLLLFGGSLVELWLVDHTKEAIQWLAFVLAGLGAITALLVLLRTSKGTVLVMRICMTFVIVGSLFGIYEHLEGNISFVREIHPDSSTSQLLSKGLRGANPLLAPGMLAVAALLTLSATYRHEVTAE